MLKIIPNPNKEMVLDLQRRIKENGGYCLCSLIKDDDHKCMCKEFREQQGEGFCHCGLYEKVEK